MSISPQRLNALNLFAACSRNVLDKIELELTTVFGRPQSELTTLISVRHCDNFTVGWLSEVLTLTHSAAVRIVDRLQASGLLSRTQQENRRYVGLMLTPAGITLADKILSVRRDVLHQLFQDISDTDLQLALPAIEKLLRQATSDNLAAYRICRQCDEAMCGPNCVVEQTFLEHEAQSVEK
jgi:DNA-binding MarR family transcriptional regulator